MFLAIFNVCMYFLSLYLKVFKSLKILPSNINIFSNKMIKYQMTVIILPV